VKIMDTLVQTLIPEIPSEFIQPL